MPEPVHDRRRRRESGQPRAGTLAGGLPPAARAGPVAGVDAGQSAARRGQPAGGELHARGADGGHCRQDRHKRREAGIKAIHMYELRSDRRRQRACRGWTAAPSGVAGGVGQHQLGAERIRRCAIGGQAPDRATGAQRTAARGRSTALAAGGPAPHLILTAGEFLREFV